MDSLVQKMGLNALESAENTGGVAIWHISIFAKLEICKSAKKQARKKKEFYAFAAELCSFSPRPSINFT